MPTTSIWGMCSRRIRSISSIFLRFREARKTWVVSTGSTTVERFPLEPGQVGAALLGERQQRVELGAVERRPLGGSLDLHELAAAGHHDVHVGLGAHVLDVGQVQAGYAVDDADADRRDRPGQRLTG